MSSLYTRISKRLKYTWDTFRSDCHFSPYYAFLRVADEIGGRIGAKRISDRAHEKKNQWISNYLENALKPVMNELRDADDTETFAKNAPIWICWWTGEETAPPLVKKCIASIRDKAGRHPVNLITQDNYEEFLTVPAYIIEKVNNKSMCIANFSDYLRFALLESYGGLWLDATIFCSQSIPISYFSSKLFTCKGPLQKSKYISGYRWTSFCFGGNQRHVLFKFLREAFEQYWKDNDRSIDYLLVDYIIDIAYRHSAIIKRDLDSIPLNNLHRDDLQAAMNAALPAEQFGQIITEDTCLYKLSWREKYSEKTTDGKDSIYSYFINN